MEQTIPALRSQERASTPPATKDGRGFPPSDPPKAKPNAAVADRVEATAAAAVEAVLQRQNEDQWVSINLQPTGSRDFQKVWKVTYDESWTDENISDVMERCIQVCQDSGIKVPPPFFEAKHALERGSTGDGQQLTGLPKLEPIRRDPPEIERIARPSELAGHLAWQERREQSMPTGLPKLEPIRRDLPEPFRRDLTEIERIARPSELARRCLPDDDRLPPIPDLGR